MNKNFIIAGVVILVLGLAIAIGVTLSSEPVAAGLPEGETSVEGNLLPTFAGDNDDNVAPGLPAPIFSAPNEFSEIVSLEKNGNAKALLFLAHWCGYCQKEVPVVQGFIDKFGVPNGVDVIAIATSIDRGRENYPPQEWLANEGWTETQLYDLDKDLNVVARRTGNLPEDMVGALLIQLASQ